MGAEYTLHRALIIDFIHLGVPKKFSNFIYKFFNCALARSQFTKITEEKVIMDNLQCTYHVITTFIDEGFKFH